MLSQEDYKEKTVLNKWYFGKGSTCDVGYDIPQEIYNRMKLTGYNVCHNWPICAKFTTDWSKGH